MWQYHFPNFPRHRCPSPDSAHTPAQSLTRALPSATTTRFRPRAAWFQCSSTFSRRKGAPKPSRTCWQGSAWSPLPGLTRMLQLVQRQHALRRLPATTRVAQVASGWLEDIDFIAHLADVLHVCSHAAGLAGYADTFSAILASRHKSVSGNRLLTGHDFQDLAQDNQPTARLFTSCRSRSPPAWARSRAP